MDSDGREQREDPLTGQANAGRSWPRASWSRVMLGLVLLAAVVLVARNLSDLAALGRTLKRAQPLWLLAALLLQALTYVAVASGWAAVLAEAGARRPLRRLVPIAVGKLFAD